MDGCTREIDINYALICFCVQHKLEEHINRYKQYQELGTIEEIIKMQDEHAILKHCSELGLE